ncbi:hypothetical protein PLICRDRAFT_55314 [Plicaturopsis crispa FD-325 SS-3]|nr:hypothetical protein PLICRDRAFT_55314 [Plicaturopsis crispa FD-325 SS-3]
MASSVFYKFKSQRDESRVTFDGTGISVFDLKREIILANNLGKANDFDLSVFDSSSQQELKDDSHIIPRSSSVIVKRLPSARPGKGKAAMYVAGAGGAPATPASEPARQGPTGGGANSWHKGSMSKRFDGKEEHHHVPTPPKPSPLTAAPVTSSAAQDDEASAMAAMFQAQTANWEETQEKMSQLVSPSCGFLVLCSRTIATRVYNNPRGTGFQRGGKPHTPAATHQHQHHQPERPLPPAYVCYRCGQKGHWIQDCPTNNDREYDNRPRIKRTTGIPRSFLKSVENPNSGQMAQGIMVTPEGGYVVAQPDSASWQKQVTRPKGLTAADVRERTPSDPALVCPIDNKLFRDAVKTPCCGTLYCEECIQTHLLERDFLCPNCDKKIASLDRLVMDKPMRTKVADYIDKVIEESKKESSDEANSTEPVASGSASNGQTSSNPEQEYWSEQQPGGNIDMSQMLVESIPQLQAQISQISVMLQNPSLPHQVRQTTQMQHHQLQIQLQQAQAVAGALAAANTFQQQQQMQQAQHQSLVGGYNGQGYQQQKNYQGGWTNPFSNQQPAGQESAYQRLPLNNRRRNLKRDRPSDFLEIAGNEQQNKVARYWE